MTRDSLEKAFRFCPACGGKALVFGRQSDVRCEACGFHFFANAVGAVAALIVDGSGRLLMTRRAGPPGAGLLDLPGGFIDAGESAEEALVREIREELGLSLERWRYWRSFPNRYPYAGLVVHTIDLVFGCRVADLNTLRPADDVSEVVFVDPTRVRPEAVGLESIRAILEALAGIDLDHLLRTE